MMRLLVILLLGLSGVALAASPEQIASLIERLGSNDYRERQMAFRELDAIGLSALPRLKSTIATGDSETRLRAAELVRRIEQRESSARILSATLVELDFDATPIDDAAKTVSEKTKIAIAVSGNNVAEINKRKVTLHTGKVPAWDAFQAFLREAKLCEWDTQTLVAGLPPPVSAQIEVGQQFVRGNRGGAVILRSGTTRQTTNFDKTLIYEGFAPPIPTCVAGAVRIRALPTGTPVPNSVGNADDIIVPLQVSLESKIDWAMTSVSIKSAQAVDDQGRQLLAKVTGIVPNTIEDSETAFINNMIIANQLAAIGGNTNGRNQFLALRLRKPNGTPTSLREVSGIMSLPIRINGELATLERPLQTGGANVRTDLGELSVHSVDKSNEKECKVDLSVLFPVDVQMISPKGQQAAIEANLRFRGFGGPQIATRGVTVQDGAKEALGISLLDAKGIPIPIASVTQQNFSYTGDGMRLRAMFTFRMPVEGSESCRLVVNGNYPVTVEVAFVLKDVLLQ